MTRRHWWNAAQMSLPRATLIGPAHRPVVLFAGSHWASDRILATTNETAGKQVRSSGAGPQDESRKFP